MENPWRAYMHVERIDSEEVDGLLAMPDIIVEPKIDGLNASVVLQDGALRVAKRTQVLGEGHDIRGLATHIEANRQKFMHFFANYPNTIIYGEFLVRHTVRHYAPDAWNRFYGFDVLDLATGLFMRPDKRLRALLDSGIDAIPPIATLKGPLTIDQDYQQLRALLGQNRFLITDPDPKLIGEGIVIKAFDGDMPYRNKYGRVTWAKIVTEEFKEKHRPRVKKTAPKEPQETERLFAETYVTPGRVEKCKHNIAAGQGTGWRPEYIGQLFGAVYRDAFREELFEFVKANKVTSINFKALNSQVVVRIKQILGL